MKTLIAAILLSVASLQAATTNLVFTWDVPALPGANGFKFYEIVSGARVFMGGTTTNRFTVNNFTIGEVRTFVVTTTNLNGESSESTPYVAPPLPPTPGNLRPAAFNFTAPSPAVVELSRDLIDWRDRVRVGVLPVNTPVSIELVQIPTEPILFGRVKPPAITTTPPLPR